MTHFLDDNFAVILKSVTGHHNYFKGPVCDGIFFVSPHSFFFLQLSSKIGVKMLFLDYPYHQFCIACYLSSVLFEEKDPNLSINLQQERESSLHRCRESGAQHDLTGVECLCFGSLATFFFVCLQLVSVGYIGERAANCCLALKYSNTK